MSAFLVFGSALDTIEYVRKQLSHYTYTFPKVTAVSRSRTALTLMLIFVSNLLRMGW